MGSSKKESCGLFRVRKPRMRVMMPHEIFRFTIPPDDDDNSDLLFKDDDASVAVDSNCGDTHESVAVLSPTHDQDHDEDQESYQLDGDDHDDASAAVDSNCGDTHESVAVFSPTHDQDDDEDQESYQLDGSFNLYPPRSDTSAAVDSIVDPCDELMDEDGYGDVCVSDHYPSGYFDPICLSCDDIIHACEHPNDDDDDVDRGLEALWMAFCPDGDSSDADDFNLDDPCDLMNEDAYGDLIGYDQDFSCRTESLNESPSPTRHHRAHDDDNESFDLECNLCLKMARDPVVVPCGHLFCGDCLDKWLYLFTSQMQCPACRSKGLDDSNHSD